MANPIQSVGAKSADLHESESAARAKDAVVQEDGGRAPETTRPAPVVQKSPAPPPVISDARVTMSVDAQLREVIVKVVDPESGEVVRQIPAEERLRQQRAYRDAGTAPAARENGAKS